MYQSNTDLVEAPYARDGRSFRPYGDDDLSDADGLTDASKASKNYMLGLNYSPDASEFWEGISFKQEAGIQVSKILMDNSVFRDQRMLRKAIF